MNFLLLQRREFGIYECEFGISEREFSISEHDDGMNLV